MSTAVEAEYLDDVRGWIWATVNQSSSERPTEITFTLRDTDTLTIVRQKQLLLDHIIPGIEEQGYSCRLVFHGTYLDLSLRQPGQVSQKAQDDDDQNPFISSDDDSEMTDDDIREDEDEGEDEDEEEEGEEDEEEEQQIENPISFQRTHYIISEVPPQTFAHCICGVQST